MPSDLQDGFRLAEFTVQPRAGTIAAGSESRRVEPRVMDVLLCLARQPGMVVTRDALVDAVWGHVHVTDDALTRCISSLRQVLGDTPGQPKFIETVPKRGYRLLVTPAPCRDNAPVHRGQRRLAAIMFTDLVGYSALTRRDEALALRVLDQHRALVRPVFAAHGGREIKTLGDGFLLDYPSALDAVRAGLAMQATMAEHNARQPEGERVELRIGVHLGDVEYRDGDVLGDGVNIAARLEPLAGPGEMCISEDVARQVQHRIDTPLEELGPQHLKNIDTPVIVYRAGTGVRKIAAAGRGTAESQSIAVLPFANISADPTDEYFSDGMSEELLNALSRVPDLRVAARTSAFSFRNSTEDAATIGARLRVGRLLEGSVRKAGSRLRITARLVNCADGYQIWSGRYDRELDDVFAIQEEIAGAIVEALKVNLPDRGGRKDAPDLRAYDLYLMGRDQMYRRTPESLARAIDLFRQAIALDPGYALAYAGLTTAFALAMEYSEMPVADATRQTGESIRRAAELGPDLPETHGALGLLRWFQGRLPEAAVSLQTAVQLNPNYAQAHMWRGNVLVSRGQLTEGLAAFRVVRELDPLNAANARNLALVLLRMNRFPEAADTLRQLLEIDPNDTRAYWILVAGHTAYGDLAGACAWGRRALQAEADAVSRVHCYGARAMACAATGQFETADQAYGSAHALVPQSPMIAEGLTELCFMAGWHPRMLELSRRWLEAVGPPAQRPLTQPHREALLRNGFAEVVNGKHRSAVASLERVFEPEYQYWSDGRLEVGGLARLAEAYGHSGNDAMRARTLERAFAALEFLTANGADDPALTVERAGLHLMSGDLAGAIAALGAAVDQGWCNPFWLEQDSRWRTALREPALAKMLARMHAAVQRAAAAGC